MGPRLLRRGDTRIRGRIGRSGRSFNGAAAVTPRRPAVWCLRAAYLAGLQWGRGCYAAETARQSPDAAALARTLQWGRGCYAAETSERDRVPYDLWVLQWGRGCYAAETELRARRLDVPCRASMGPRLLRRGDHVQLRGASGRFCWGFNGAAAVTPRRPRAYVQDRLINGRFNGAAAVTPRRRSRNGRPA